MSLMDSGPRLAIIAAAVLVVALPDSSLAKAPLPAPSSKHAGPSVRLAEARVIIDCAIVYARHVPMAVMVVDAAGNPVSSDRMDGVSANNILYAQGKAPASALQWQTTQNLSEPAKDRPERYFGIMAMYPGKMYLVGGGVSIVSNGALVGAAGVAGLAQYEDEAAGRAGIAARERFRVQRL